MKLVFKKIMDKKGNVRITVNNNETNHYLSRIITETDYEDNYGIFSLTKNYISFTYGKYKKNFNFNNLDDNDFEKYVNEINNRITQVRKWVKECKDKEKTETIILVINDDDNPEIDTDL